jgi:hypothetical protein
MAETARQAEERSKKAQGKQIQAKKASADEQSGKRHKK